ncbi:MAG: ATP-binding protein [Betaproteobacteria bacterium]
MAAAGHGECEPRLASTGRLYWRIWLAVLASLALFAVMVAGAWKLFSERPYNTQQQIFAELAAGVLPPPGAPASDVKAALDHWKVKLRSDLALFAGDGTPLGATSELMPAPPVGRPADDWVGNAHGMAFSMHLPDGRFLLSRRLYGPRPAPLGLLGILALVALAVGVGTYPVVRRLTRRLERLQASVDRLGRGDLSARVSVHGHDEVARLARSFNTAAARIEQLVGSHRLLLANASHELRSPLARVRMAVEMLQAVPRQSPQAAQLQRDVGRDIAELDALIDEILLSARLEAADSRSGFAPLDLAALCAEECARAGSGFEAVARVQPPDPFVLRGDARLLRRTLRNLLENAQRYGAGSPVEVTLERTVDAIVLNVCDRGPGVTAAERERIFEPFYRPAGTLETAGGVGLGLALVRKIVQQHDGQVACRPREGGGSCFEVRLGVVA